MTTTLNRKRPAAARPGRTRRGSDVAAATLLAWLLALCSSAAASAAGTVQIVVAAPNATLQFTAGAGDVNAVTVTQSASAFTIADGGAIIDTTDPACTGGGTNTVTCTSAAITRIGATLGDGNDTITNNSNIGSLFDGGPGADTLVGSSAATNAGRDFGIRGGDGNDTLDGRGGADTLVGDLGADHAIGGDGNDLVIGRTSIPGLPGDGGDLLEGGDGVDQLNGGGGSDMLLGGPDTDTLDGEEDGDVAHGDDGDDILRESRDDAVDNLVGDAGDDQFLIAPFPFGPKSGADVLDGSGGIDEAMLIEVSMLIAGTPSPPSQVSLDDAVANDGFEGQFVAMRNVEDVTIDAFGGSADIVRGNDAANALTTGQGDDVVDGLGGTDVISLGDGDDELEARDGFYDRISCGPGADAVAVDQLDDVSDCEAVTTTYVAPVGIVAPPDIVLPPPAPPAAAPPPPPAPVAPADTAPPRCTITAPATIRTLGGGVPVGARCDEAASLELTLTARVVRAGGVRAARAGDLELTTRSLPLRGAARSVRLTVSRKLRGAVGGRATLRLQVRARDAAGNRRTTSTSIRLRARR